MAVLMAATPGVRTNPRKAHHLETNVVRHIKSGKRKLYSGGLPRQKLRQLHILNFNKNVAVSLTHSTALIAAKDIAWQSCTGR
jgi:hypothetical protein